MTPGPPSRRLDLAFLGCGRVAEAHSRRLSRLDPDVRLHYASRDGKRAEALRARRGGAGAFGSYDAACADPAIDVVLVATPPHLHLELALRALDGGKDVVVEKPAFLQPEDFSRVREASARTGRRVFVAENYYYKPIRRWLAEVLTAELVGEPLVLRVDALKRQEASGWRADPAVAGGGGLFEGGIHWIHFMASLGLAVESVVGHRAGDLPRLGDPGTRQGRRRFGPAGEETVVVVFRYEGGAVGVLSFSWEVPAPFGGLGISRIHGREGTVTFESNGAFAVARGRRTRVHLPRLRDVSGYRGMFADFLDAVRTGREPLMTLDMGERDVRLAREIYRSLGSDEPIQEEG